VGFTKLDNHRRLRVPRQAAARPHLEPGDPLAGMESLERARKSCGFRAVCRRNREQNNVVFAYGPHAEAYPLAARRFPPPAPEG